MQSTAIPATTPYKTVGRIAQKNRYVSTLPPPLRLPDHVQISKAELNGYAFVQLFGFLGIPASTIPIMMQDPSKYWTGAAIGAVAIIVCEFASSSLLNPSFKDYMNWWTHSASMNTLGKAMLGGAHVFGISTNTLVNMSIEPGGEIYPYVQGALAGSLVTSQLIRAIMSIVQQALFAPKREGSAVILREVGSDDVAIDIGAVEKNAEEINVSASQASPQQLCSTTCSTALTYNMSTASTMFASTPTLAAGGDGQPSDDSWKGGV